MNDNHITLYRIRRKADGLYLISAPGKNAGGADNVASLWGVTGAFWRQEKTIIAHLNVLCEYWLYCAEDEQKVFRSMRNIRKGRLNKKGGFVVFSADTPLKLAGIYPEWLSKYEVHATVVNEVSSTIIDAKSFITKETSEKESA